MIAYKIKSIDNTTGKVTYLYEEGDGRKHYTVTKKKDAMLTLSIVKNQMWDLGEFDNPDIDPSIYGDADHLYWRRGKKDTKNTWAIDTVFIRKD
tara:strand:+ start:249 stop:530 length:282 start_codon:yes stop_codon:yes gene_type:complete